MKKTIKFSLFIFILSIQFSSGGDFRYLRTSEGLYNGEINSIAQDKSGKMWFATWAGLTSYNGYDFQFFKPELGNPLSLSDKKINRIFIDSKDNLWIASLSGVSLFRKDDQTFHLVKLEGLESATYYVFNFLESKGNVLIHTNAGIFLVYRSKEGGESYHTKKLTLTYQGTKVYDYIHYINTFNDDLAMVSNADSNDPLRILIGELTIDTKDTLINLKKRIVYSHQVNVICHLKNEQKLYLGTSDGISTMSLSQYSITDHAYLSGLDIQNMLVTSDHRIYCYTNDPILYYVDLNSLQKGQYSPDPLNVGSLLDNNIMCMFEDFSGNLWIGHQGLGLSILNLNRKAFSSFKRDPSNNKSLSGNIVMCINSTKQEILVGLRQGGLNVTSKKIGDDGSAEFKVISYMKQNRPVSVFDNIWDIARESDSLFWIASDGGLAKLEKTYSGWIYGKPGERPL